MYNSRRSASIPSTSAASSPVAPQDLTNTLDLSLHRRGTSPVDSRLGLSSRNGWQSPQIGVCPLLCVSYLDGRKIYLENDSWLLLRFSGTEPKLRIFAGADSLQKAQELVDWAGVLVQPPGTG